MLSTGVIQERTAKPSRCTVQAPHSAMPHPNLVPVMPSTSRNTQSSGVSPSTSTLCELPLISTVKAIAHAPYLPLISGCLARLLSGGSACAHVNDRLRECL